MRRVLATGMTAGAVGTLALNAATYVDMLVRGRPPSRLPDEAAELIATMSGLDLGTGDKGANRREALGALLGMAIGVSIGTVFAAIQGRAQLPRPVAAAGLTLGAMSVTNLPMTGLRLTDPRAWTRADWVADALPHLAYGAAATATYALLDSSRRTASSSRGARA